MFSSSSLHYYRFGFLQHVKANGHHRWKIRRRPAFNVRHHLEHVLHGLIPLRVAGAFQPVRMADVSFLVHVHGHLRDVIVIGQVLRPVPFLTQRIFHVALVKLHGITFFVHRLGSITEFKGRRLGRRRSDHRRGHGGRRGGFWRFHSFGRFHLRHFLRRLGLFLRLFRLVLRPFFLGDGNALDFFSQHPCSRREVKRATDQDGVKNHRDDEVRLRRVFRFLGLGLRDHLFTSVARSTFTIFAC